MVVNNNEAEKENQEQIQAIKEQTAALKQQDQTNTNETPIKVSKINLCYESLGYV